MEFTVDESVRVLFDAIERGHHEAVQACLRRDPQLASALDPRCFGTPAVVRASSTNDRRMIDILLAAGADPNQRSDWWAGSFGVLDSCNETTADYLVQRGATLTPHAAARLGKQSELRAILERDPQAVHARGGDGQFPLHFSKNQAIAELLLAHGAEIDALDVDHEATAAQYLATERPKVAAYLVSRGAKVDIFMAAMIGDVPRLQALVAADAEGANARISRRRFPTSEMAGGHIYLFTVGEGCTLMHAAANGNQVEVIRFLDAAGADVNAHGGYDEQTPLHATGWRDRPEAAAALLDAGADINARSGRQHHNSPLGWAIVSGAAGAVRLLLDRGAAVYDIHREDARSGVAGRFRAFNRTRPAEAWSEIERWICAEEEV